MASNKVLIIGANGFIGTYVRSRLSINNDVIAAGRDLAGGLVEIDLSSKKSIEDILKKHKPEVIINCAGVVDNTEKANLNFEFTKNLLSSIDVLDVQPKIIICGSASTYGVVGKDNLPVKETCEQKPVGFYAEAKKKEEDFALKYATENGLDLVVLRIFNPIGIGMHSRFLISNVLLQIDDIKKGKSDKITVFRKDSARDYIDIRDVAEAIELVTINKNSYNVYNIGAGVAVTNIFLIKKLLKLSNLSDVKVEETGENPEPVYAVQADITRIGKDLGWEPKYRLSQTLEEIINGNKKP